MNMKKIISLVLALCMLLACVPAMAAGYTAGTYTAEVRGMQAIKVSVTFSAGYCGLAMSSLMSGTCLS